MLKKEEVDYSKLRNQFSHGTLPSTVYTCTFNNKIHLYRRGLSKSSLTYVSSKAVTEG